jgi:AcrR family transcriptional regulator
MAAPATSINDNKSIRRQSVQLNKELVVKTAARLFTTAGYEAVSLDDIAKEIGATKGLIYYYFPSKGALLGEVLLWNHGAFLESVDPAYEPHGVDPVGKLRKVIKAHVEFNYEHYPMIELVWRTMNLVPVDMRRKLKKQREAYLKKFCLLVEEAQQTGKMIKGDSEIVGTSITTLLNFLPYQFRKSKNRGGKELFELVTTIYFR